jgi:hypothetical protein
MDHAQNGFWHATEWIGVAASAGAVGALVGVIAYPAERSTRRLATGMLLLQMGVGLLGFWLHGQANLRGEMSSVRDRFLYGAPIFAPLLFNNLALLGLLGLWGLVRIEPTAWSSSFVGRSGEAAVAPGA